MKPDGKGKKPDAGRKTPGCRCEEVAKKTKTPRELLKIMLDDLAFWKKAKKEKK
ncbi:MAG: hypothetical protein M0Z59_06585 [Nitrospiraceae bacterium]|nr:hypothetical protein [Nitrospiraceae bacterium]